MALAPPAPVVEVAAADPARSFLYPSSSSSSSLCSQISSPLFKSQPPSSLPPAVLHFPLSSSSKGSLRIVARRLSRRRPPPVVACLKLPSGGEPSEGNYEPDASSSSKEIAFDIKLPRRSLLVQFTCNSCGERTQRLINRMAYERGTVFVQCAGCLVNHKLVDNLGLVVEYDLRGDINTKPGAAEEG